MIAKKYNNTKSKFAMFALFQYNNNILIEEVEEKNITETIFLILSFKKTLNTGNQYQKYCSKLLSIQHEKIKIDNYHRKNYISQSECKKIISYIMDNINYFTKEEPLSSVRLFEILIETGHKERVIEFLNQDVFRTEKERIIFRKLIEISIPSLELGNEQI